MVYLFLHFCCRAFFLLKSLFRTEILNMAACRFILFSFAFICFEFCRCGNGLTRYFLEKNYQLYFGTVYISFGCVKPKFTYKLTLIIWNWLKPTNTMDRKVCELFWKVFELEFIRIKVRTYCLAAFFAYSIFVSIPAHSEYSLFFILYIDFWLFVFD